MTKSGGKRRLINMAFFSLGQRNESLYTPDETAEPMQRLEPSIFIRKALNG
jgi:hypothetical protein